MYKLNSYHKNIVMFKTIRFTRLNYEIIIRSYTLKTHTSKPFLQLNPSRINYIVTYTHTNNDTHKYTQTYTDTHTYTQYPKLYRISISINLTYNNG